MNNITIAIPIYNTKIEYLTRLFDCIDSQTYKEFDILICDDGSTDKNTITFIEKLKTKCIIIHSESNKGIYETRNILLSNCNTKYIAFVDSDDLIPNDYIEKLITPLLSNENALTFCNYVFLPKKQKKVLNNKVLKTKTYYDNLLDFGLTGKMGHNLWGKVFETKILKNYKIKEELGFDDAQCIPILAAAIDKIINVNTIYIYLQNENSIMHLNQKPLFQAYLTYKYYLTFNCKLASTKLYLETHLKLAYLKLFAIDYSPQFQEKIAKTYIKDFKKMIFKMHRVGLSKKDYLSVFLAAFNFKLFKRVYCKKRRNK